MHGLFELLLISFTITSRRVARASQLPDNVDFVPYIKNNYIDTRQDDAKLVSELIGHEERSLGGMSLHELFARQAQGALRSDLQTFTGALGGIKAPSITQSNNRERPFQVESNTFPNYMEAAVRTCDIQNNECSDMVNAQGAADDAGDDDGDASDGLNAAPVQQTTAQQRTTTTQNDASSAKSSTASSSTSTLQNGGNSNQRQGSGNGTVNAGNQKRQNRMTLDMCSQQMTQCNTVVRAAAVQSFELANLGPDPNDPDFDLLCAP